MTERVLFSSINGELVGTLREVNGIWSFRYAAPWLDNPQHYPLSPQLPLHGGEQQDLSTTRHVQWYFDNLLPEEAQRKLLARDAHIDFADAFGLLGYYGSESAGSLTLLPLDAPTQSAETLRPLSDQQLNDRILHLPHTPLTHGSNKRMSLAGAQHKLAVVLRDGQLFEPGGATPSTHILKPDHQDTDYPHSVANEWFVMRLAKRLGLEVPNVYRRYVPAPVYIIERFDRIQDKEGWKRLHVIDACQLLGLDRGFKYSQGSMDTLASIADACRGSAIARTQLFKWLVFNVLIGNTDAHLKNLSFMISAEGIKLAPHYDLLSTACYETRSFDKNSWPEQTRLAWPILDVSHFSDIDRAVLIRAGEALNIAKPTAERLLSSMIGRAEDAIAGLYAEVEAENQAIIDQTPSLAATIAGEARCLRAIQHVIAKDMVGKLA